MLNRLKKYEEEYCRNTYCGNSEGGDFRFEDRGSRLILTAPHAVRTLRDNRPKAPDLCTGALTRLAGEQNDVSTIIRRRTGEERNAAAGFVIDRQLANHCFLDIHGMNGGRHRHFTGRGLCAGTGTDRPAGGKIQNPLGDKPSGLHRQIRPYRQPAAAEPSAADSPAGMALRPA